jgi:hypothetical protein
MAAPIIRRASPRSTTNGVADIAALIRYAFDQSSGRPVILACASMGGFICQGISRDEQAVRYLKGMALLGGPPDPESAEMASGKAQAAHLFRAWRQRQRLQVRESGSGLSQVEGRAVPDPVHAVCDGQPRHAHPDGRLEKGPEFSADWPLKCWLLTKVLNQNLSFAYQFMQDMSKNSFPNRRRPRFCCSEPNGEEIFADDA